MIEKTSSTKKAAKRLAAHLGWKIHREKGASKVSIEAPQFHEPIPPRKASQALAFMADAAMGTPLHMTAEEIQEVVNWDGRISQRGLSGWEYGMLAQLKDVHGTEWRGK